jgi:hypothetical protein
MNTIFDKRPIRKGTHIVIATKECRATSSLRRAIGIHSLSFLFVVLVAARAGATPPSTRILEIIAKAIRDTDAEDALKRSKLKLYQIEVPEGLVASPGTSSGGPGTLGKKTDLNQDLSDLLADSAAASPGQPATTTVVSEFIRHPAPGLLPLPTDPVDSLKKYHWTALPPMQNMLDTSVQVDLVAAFNRYFSEYGKDPQAARLAIQGLNNVAQQPSEAAKGLTPQTTEAIDRWAQECLRVAKEATGEDLEITSVSVGRGFKVGNGEGSLIHADTWGTYLHALITLEGPTTFVFPESPELAQHRLLSINENGTMTVRKVTSRDEDPAASFTIEKGGCVKPGETILFGGGDYINAKSDRQAVQHASPPSTDLNRLTLFISIGPKK